MGTKWTRKERRRYQDELRTGISPDVREIFLTPKMKRKREEKRRKVAERLLGNSRKIGVDLGDAQGDKTVWKRK